MTLKFKRKAPPVVKLTPDVKKFDAFGGHRDAQYSLIISSSWEVLMSMDDVIAAGVGLKKSAFGADFESFIKELSDAIALVDNSDMLILRSKYTEKQFESISAMRAATKAKLQIVKSMKSKAKKKTLAVPSRTFALTNAVCHCSSRGPRCAI